MADKQEQEKTKGGALNVREVQSPGISDKDLKRGGDAKEDGSKGTGHERS